MTDLDRVATGPTLEAASVSRRRGRRWLRRILVAVVVLLALLYAGVGWYASSEIIDGLDASADPVDYGVDVVSVTDTRVELIPDPDDSEADEDVDAVMGLRWEEGYAQVGPSTVGEGGEQSRPLTLLSGELPPVGTDVANLHSWAFPSDPSVLGLDIQTVTYPAPLGDLTAWYVPGDRDTWVVSVHGLGAGPAEFLRTVEAIGDLGYPMLLVNYRNDADAPQTEDGLVLAGQNEWRDVAAAIDHARANGASDVVLHGASMGGALSLAYAVNTEQDDLAGLILEAPAADLRHIVDLRSGEALPVGGWLGDTFLAAGRLFTWVRTGLDFDEVDYVERADELDVPVLLFHGRQDEPVPFVIGESLAEARPDLVEFHPVEDAAHVRAWNEDPEGYAATLEQFLGRVADDA